MDVENIVVSNVYKQYYDTNGNKFDVLKDVSFVWNKGENIAVIGESGSGKSTLARMIIGIENVTSGKIEINNEDIKKWNFKNSKDMVVYNSKKISGYDFVGTPCFFKIQNLKPAN